MKKNNSQNNNGENGVKRTKVAVFCILAILIFYLGANFLKGIDILGSKNYYYAVFNHSGGLQESNPVSINGYKIGKVTKIKLISENPIKICAEILVTEPISIPKDSKFEVAPKDILGGTVVNLIMGNDTEYAQSGDTLNSYVVPQMTDGIEEMKDKLNNILSSVDTIGVSLKEVVASTGASNLKNTLANLETSTRYLNEILAQNKSNVGHLVQNLTAFSQTLEKATPQLNNIIDNLDELSDTIVKADIIGVINHASSTIYQIEEMVLKANKGEGTLGQVLNNDTLYKNLELTTASLNALLLDLQQNPKKYVNITVFGKKDKSNQKQ